MKAIPTLYRGTQFRSRLEAKWAAFFDRIDWDWTYEPFDADGYIPDFLIHGDRPLIVEVKPAATIGEYRAPIAKVTGALCGHWKHDILIAGADPRPLPQISSWLDLPPAGLLGEAFNCDDYPFINCADHRQGKDNCTDWDFEAGEWFYCLYCQRINIKHRVQSYQGRPCGDHDGDHYLGHVDPDDIRAKWAAAGNDVMWRGRST